MKYINSEGEEITIPDWLRKVFRECMKDWFAAGWSPTEDGFEDCKLRCFRMRKPVYCKHFLDVCFREFEKGCLDNVKGTVLPEVEARYWFNAWCRYEEDVGRPDLETAQMVFSFCGIEFVLHYAEIPYNQYEEIPGDNFWIVSASLIPIGIDTRCGLITRTVRGALAYDDGTMLWSYEKNALPYLSGKKGGPDYYNDTYLPTCEGIKATGRAARVFSSNLEGIPVKKLSNEELKIY